MKAKSHTPPILYRRHVTLVAWKMVFDDLMVVQHNLIVVNQRHALAKLHGFRSTEDH